jgi:hypothetical protein
MLWDFYSWAQVINMFFLQRKKIQERNYGFTYDLKTNLGIFSSKACHLQKDCLLLDLQCRFLVVSSRTVKYVVKDWDKSNETSQSVFAHKTNRCRTHFWREKSSFEFRREKSCFEFLARKSCLIYGGKILALNFWRENLAWFMVVKFLLWIFGAKILLDLWS